MLPSFTCTAIHKDNAADTISIDIATALVNGHLGQAQRLLEKIENGETILVHEISAALPDRWRQAFMHSNARIPDLYESGRAFSEAVHGLRGLESWMALATARQQATWRVASATRLQKAVEGASFTTLSSSGTDMLYDEISGNFSDLDGAIDAAFSFDDLVAAIGPRDWDAPEQVSAAYSERANRWVRENARPFAFATRPRTWTGISLDTLTAALEDDPELTEAQFLQSVWSDIECDLGDNHFENAFESVVSGHDLDTALKAWLQAFRRTPSQSAIAFEPIKAWNRKQTITSHFPDIGTLVALFDDVTPDEVRQWVERYVAEANAGVTEIEALWRTPISDPTSAIAAAAVRGYAINYGPKHSASPAWRWSNADIESPAYLTLELCVEAINQLTHPNGTAT